MNNMKREAVREAEVISLDGRDVVTLMINGQLFDMSSAVALAISRDLKAGAKRAKE
jgi:hypothetical protein